MEISGAGLARLATVVKSISEDPEFSEIKFYLAPPNFGLALSVIPGSTFGIVAQHLDLSEPGASTGSSVPEVARGFGAIGSIINHSEDRVSENVIAELISRLRRLEMVSIVCAKDDGEVSRFAGFGPDFIAVEPPDLIGSGKAVSKVRPEAITGSKRALDQGMRHDYPTKLLCGAGIVEGIDARLAVEIGAEGILVASGVIKSGNWKDKIEELARGLNAAQRRREDSKEKL